MAFSVNFILLHLFFLTFISVVFGTVDELWTADHITKDDQVSGEARHFSVLNKADQNSHQVPSSCSVMFSIPDKAYHSCCAGRCRCSDNITDCSGNLGTLNFTIDFSITSHTLILSYNGIRGLPSELFYSDSMIENLVLSHNLISYVDHTWFSNLPNLRSLDLSHNILVPEAVAKLLTIPTLRCLDVSFNNFRDIRPYNQGTQSVIERIFIQGNPLETLDLRIFSSSPQLRMIVSSSSNISHFVPTHLPNLEIWSLANNSFTYFPQTIMCSSNGQRFPSLTMLDLSENLLQSFPSPNCTVGGENSDSTTKFYYFDRGRPCK
jgi:Leucine-rich repeat (LRR) protein